MTLFVLGGVGRAQEAVSPELFNGSHDITSLSLWGPYSKRYAGISHIADLTSGVRVDFTVIPGYYRRSFAVPDVLFESGYYPWRCNPQMTDITYRYQLEWKDRVYVDATYHLIDSSRVLVEMECVNESDAMQNLLLHLTTNLAYDEDRPVVAASGDEECSRLSGCDYVRYEPAVKRYDYALIYDGWLRGEGRDRLSLSGSILKDFGSHIGDRVEYVVDLPDDNADFAMAIRYRLPEGRTARLLAHGVCEEEMTFVGQGDYAIARFDCSLQRTTDTLILVSDTAEPVTIDALFFGPRHAIASVGVVERPLSYRPRIEESGQSLIAKYEASDNYYGMAWNYPDCEIKEYENSDLDVFMRRTVHRHPPRYFTGDRQGYYTSAFMRPVVLEPRSRTTLYALLATGTRQEVGNALTGFQTEGEKLAAQVAARHTPLPALLPEAAEFALGEQLLEATLFTNIVYPVYTQNSFIRHFTPGKNWNSLYTWDSGFISWALTELDPVKAFETIRAYTTDETSQSAFIHHGTPLPIQFFAFADLNNRLQSIDVAAYLYPRLKRYYDFMAGHDTTSTTRMPSNLLRTWDYFYSSGGWDDYPPQHYLRSHTDLYSSVAPMVSTAYYIRAAKILRTVARRLGLRADERHYDEDIRRFTEAVQHNAWDPESGYFGYVMHDESGNPTGIFRHADGSNFNKGLDGVAPLVAGICTPEQTERLLKNLFDEERMWCPTGISTVDQSASYYDPTGYWNGGVWMPHQFIIWKSLLDNNRIDFAHRVAFTALRIWNRECAESYNSCEHFIVSSGRGGGWHNFSGLSSPMINWFMSYFCIGHVATGFDVSLSDSEFSDDCSAYSAVLRFDKSVRERTVALLLCMNPGYDYEARFNGRPVETVSPYDGLLYVSVPATARGGTLEIRRK